MILVTWRATRGYELFPDETKVRLRDMISGPLQNRPFRYVVALYSVGLVGMTIGGSVGVYFMTYVLGFTENQIAFALLITFGLAIAWIPVIDFLSSMFGKRAAWMIMIGQWALVMGVGIQFLIQPGRTVLFYVLAFFLGGGLTSVYMIGWAMIPDCVEVDEFKTGMRREGLYFGVIAFAQKGACAMALWVVGVALSWIGYVPDAAQSEATLQGIRTINGGVEAAFLVASILLCYAMPMTREKHQALCEALVLKREGKPYDREPFEDLL
jgi:GPH family glycoside/pentoside/hexuronide:cation symporter